ncbi:MAG: T9SS type A sorting domain-containing protein [Sphingobacteriales bacterium]|nr:MAG: T9SS type A sorting domain-containing protein [Sphingobacteriales bacterium]
MKKFLLTALVTLSALAAGAQSKTTGTVTLQTGQTAKLDLNNSTTTATLTLTGPSDRWFAVQFGSFSNGQGMASGMDVVYYNGTFNDGFMQGIGSPPAADANNWTVSSNTVSGTTRTIVATRAFAGGTNDYTFVYNDANIDFAYARGASATNDIFNHGTFRGYKLNQAFTCLAPDAPTAAAQSFCSGATVANLTATGGAGATFSWYAAATGGTPLASTTTLTNATYYVSQTLSACESARTPVAVTVTIVGQPATSATQSFCNAATVANLSATATGGATISWYSAATGGTALAATTPLVSGTTYYVGQTQGSCASTRTAVAVTINTTAAPTAAATQTYCAGATVASLQATGTGIKWYSTIGGAQLATTAVLAAGNYYATQTLNGCESTTTPVAVSITPLPATPSGDPTQDFDNGDTVADLTIGIIVGAQVQWYTLISAGVYLEISSTTQLVNGTTYYVTQQVGDCESDYFAVTVSQIAASGSFSLAGLKAYPNPASDVLTITNKAELAGVSVVNMLGQEVLQQKVSGTTVQLSVAQLAGGTYIVKVLAANGATASIKIAKY